MPSQSRRYDQNTDTFSASKVLLERARSEAARRGMSKSGFYRYCLAKECGFTQEESLDMAQHRGLVNAINASRLNEVSAPNSGIINAQVGKKNMPGGYVKIRDAKKKKK